MKTRTLKLILYRTFHGSELEYRRLKLNMDVCVFFVIPKHVHIFSDLACSPIEFISFRDINV